MKRFIPLSLISVILFFSISINITAQYIVKPMPVNYDQSQESEKKDAKLSYEVVWSETFNGSLPGSWQNVNVNGFCSFQHTYAGPQGPFSVGIPPINSTTGANGFMILDSDLCNASNSEYEVVDAYIESPAINLSDYNSVGLRFEHFFRFCCDPALIELKVLVSNNGVNWVSFDVSNGLSPNNTSANPLVTILNISAVAGGRETVWVRFHKKGASQYFWMIDDVSVISLTENDIELTDIMHDGYTMIPSGVKSSVNVGGVVKNSGSTAQSDVKLSVQINEYLAILESEVIPSLNPSSQIQFDISEPFVFPGKGLYNLVFNASQNQTDQIPANNSEEVSILVGDSVYARDAGLYSPGYLVWPAQDVISHTGNMFMVEKSVEATSISVALHQNTLADEVISAVLFEFTALGGFSEISRSTSYTIAEEDINIVEGDARWLSIQLDEITLDANKQYLAAIEYNSNNVAIAADNIIWQPIGAAFSKITGNWVAESATPMVRLNFGGNVGDCNILAEFEIVHDFCGFGNGSISAFPTTGIPPYNYAWDTDPIDETSSITGLSEGVYTLLITDSHNCFNEFAIEIESKDIEYNVVVIPSACNGANGIATVTPLSGQSPFTFSWNTDPVQTGATAVGLMPGEYNVTITDANTCEIIAPVIVTSINEITLTYEATAPVCLNANGSINVIPLTGTTPFSYVWSNDDLFDQAIQNNLVSGSYTITVTDFNECVGEITVELLSEQLELIILADIVHTTCEIDNGAILLNVTNGQEPFEYLWNTYDISKDLVDIFAGTYNVTVTDDWGCIGSAEFTVNNSGAALQINIEITNASACGVSDGAISITAVNPESDYSYSWGGGEVGPELVDIAAGTYILTVFDNFSGCQDDYEIYVSDDGIVGVNIVQNNVTCNGYDNGNISVTVDEGEFDYLWSNESTESFISNLEPGDYHLFLSNAECFAYYEFTITEPDVLVINEIEIIDPLCHNSSNGSIEIQAIGGTPDYQYTWSDQRVGNHIIDLPAGVYEVVVTDFNGCIAEESYTLLNPAEIVIIAEVVNPDPGLNNGSINVTVFNTVGEVTYNWDSGHDGAYITDLAPGIYTVTVTDENDCSAQESFELFVTSVHNPNFTEIISIFPNPVKDMLYIDFGVLSAYDWQINLYDISGVLKANINGNMKNEAVINVNGLPAGIYVIQIQSDMGKLEKLIVIN
jgi:hypothetical protein